ncbi:MAG: ABC transporter permease [Candidatus Bathyarchaeota archaeon]|nr:ABC transporter permease [Candidatus Bathyarchaeota archaeon]MDH5779530.1 ABC transporter permease [Candidatus Bathyarchaeota archaeon]
MFWELFQNPIFQITIRSLHISGTATLLSTFWSLPLGMFIGLKSFPGKQFVKGIFNTLLGVPTVALGLILYLLLSTSGPLGFLDLYLTPQAMIIGQALLVTPIVVSLATSAVESVDPKIQDLAKTLGASEVEASLAVLRESMGGIVLAIVASFNRAIAELGVALAVGRNIKGTTQVLTTVIAMEVERPNIEYSIQLVIILLAIVFTVTILTNLLQRRIT